MGPFKSLVFLSSVAVSKALWRIRDLDFGSLMVMSLQALYAQNSQIYPFITQYLRNYTIIILTHSIILPTLDNTMDFCSISHKHPDTVLKL